MSTELETLPLLLSESIEGMSIAVLAAHDGYENRDLDIRRSVLAIAVLQTPWDENDERPDYLVEDEEIWQQGSRPIVPPVID